MPVHMQGTGYDLLQLRDPQARGPIALRGKDHIAHLHEELIGRTGTVSMHGHEIVHRFIGGFLRSLDPFQNPHERCDGIADLNVHKLDLLIAANMANSWHTSPRVTYTFAVDVTAMKALRAKLKDSLKEQGIKLTYNHILMKVVAKALLEFPDVNASFADNMLTRHKHVNMGLAVAKGDGLIVPNVKNADSKSLAEIAKETEALIEATRSGKIDMKDMTGGTFTISSLGPYGVRSFSPIINQPELAILGVCDIVDTPIVCNGEIVIRPMMNLCLTADHRVVDGVMACKFMKRVVELLENPYLLLT